jgi:hypothetical protein
LAGLDASFLQQTAAGVLHYFRHELGLEEVDLADFAQALVKALRVLGYKVTAVHPAAPESLVTDSDLRQLACTAGKGYELVFFQGLRDELQRRLASAPRVVRFSGLRGCVKQLLGARRWSPRCQALSDQIVAHLRGCFGASPTARACALVVL